MTNSLLIYEESGYLFNDTTKRLEWFEIDKILIRFTGETSKMSWAALPVEPACMGKAVGEAGRPLMLCGARLYIITKV